MRVHKIFAWFIISLFLISCTHKSEINNGKLRLRWNDKLQTQIIIDDKEKEPITFGWQSSEYLVGNDFQAAEFQLKDVQYPVVKGLLWKTAAIVKGEYSHGENRLEKVVTYQYTDSLSDFLLVKVAYINTGEKPIEITHWYNHAYTLSSKGDHPAFWSFQGSSDPSRHDWIMPIDSAFYRENYMGMNATDYGGGIPMVDVWRKNVGLAIGHGSTRPERVSLPVITDSAVKTINISVSGRFSEPIILNHGDTLFIIPTWIHVHRGDCYLSLTKYAKYLHLQGIQFPAAEPGAFEPVWCAWGYGREVTREEILNTLPKVKELGFGWVDIDDGYQQAEGDWDVNLLKYPNGDTDMRRLVDEIHKAGLKAKIWWAPLAVDPGSKLFKTHPEIALINKEGKYQDITWWDSYYMSPSHPLTKIYTIQVLEKFLSAWDYDGLKVDGQHINCIPPDYNPSAEYDSPEDAPAELPAFFKMVWETARQIKPNAVIQLCPCGSVMSAFHLPYLNQAVASDPLSSWQIRTKAFVYKALAPHLAYYGDHVELSTGGFDFASQIGVGGVPGSKFTWPADHPGNPESFLLTIEKEKLMKKWISIYRQKMLSKGEYLGGLYDIGYDRPETHVIRKTDTLYYAFYDPSFEGSLIFKGLSEDIQYKVFDYVKGLTLGIVSREFPTINTTFENYLLVELTPVSKP